MVMFEQNKLNQEVSYLERLEELFLVKKITRDVYEKLINNELVQYA
jgi:hypothetical protein